MNIGYEAQLLLDSLTEEEVSMNEACEKFDCSWVEVQKMESNGLLVIRMDEALRKAFVSKPETTL